MIKKKVLYSLTGIAMAVTATAVLAQNIAIVNGKPVPIAKLEGVMNLIRAEAARSGQPIPPEMEANVRKQLIEDAALIQAAEQRGLNLTPEFATRMQSARDAILVNLLAEDHLKQHPVTDAEIKAEYDRAVGDQQEYRSHHILLETEEEANAVLAELAKGANFETLARSKSKDMGSAVLGGDLDWAPAAAYVPEFSAALQALKKGEVSKPVKTQFGYHIIRQDDARPAQNIPPFEQVKAMLAEKLQQDKVEAMQQDLISKARIQ